MQIKPIAELLRVNNLQYPKLAVLQPTVELFTAMLVQPSAVIKVRDDGIRNADRDQARKLFNSIARESHARSVELLVTPEYSFPWICVEDLLAEGIGPEEGQLWVLGCESLELAELETLKERFSPWAEVLHEPLQQQAATARYLDPLVYIFNTLTNEGLLRTVMVVQFKTTPSGDRDNIEATFMGRGQDVYLFQNGNEVRLISLICSDAFTFTDEKVDEHYENLLLLHVQLNDRPRHETYMRYRRRLYEFDCDRTEVICLNWAENITFDLRDGVEPVTKKNISCSAWHSKSLKLATGDDHVERNHRKGMYYTYDSEQLRHMLHFCYEPAAFLLQATKVRHHAVAAPLSRRLGPNLTHVLRWNSIAETWEESAEPVDDGFIKMVDDYTHRIDFLKACHATSPLEVERLSCITSGNFGPSKKWFEATTMLNVEPRTEVVLRVSVATDPEGKTFREERVRTIDALTGIPASDLPLPSHMADLLGGYSFKWINDAPNCNVVSNNEGQPATIVYVGESPSKTKITGLYARVTATVSTTPFSDRFCVLYRDGVDLKRFDPPTNKSITKTVKHPGKNFTEPEK